MYDWDGFLSLFDSNWVAEVRVRKPYTKNYGGVVNERRVLEFWQGNDALWEITCFAEGIGYVEYRQWKLQAGQGRMIEWAGSLSDNHTVRGTAWGPINF